MSKKHTNDDITNKVIDLIIERQKAGYEEYGSTLADNKGNIKYWLKHLQEELLDAAQYIEKIIFVIDKVNNKWQINDNKDTPSKDGQ